MKQNYLWHKKFQAYNLQDMQIYAKDLQYYFQNNSILCLNGDLGAGKSTLTHFIAQTFHITEDLISPSYNLICEYQGDKKFYHMDLYRLSHEEEFELIGADEILEDNQSIIIIEWPLKASSYLPKNILHLNIAINKDQSRTITPTFL